MEPLHLVARSVAACTEQYGSGTPADTGPDHMDSPWLVIRPGWYVVWLTSLSLSPNTL